MATKYIGEFKTNIMFDWTLLILENKKGELIAFRKPETHEKGWPGKREDAYCIPFNWLDQDQLRNIVETCPAL